MKNSFGSTVLMDLSKVYAYNCIPHNLGIAKLNAYDSDRVWELYLISNCLSRHKQRTKLNSSCNFYHHIIRGVSQGSTLGPLVFNIFVNGEFYFIRRSEGLFL